MFYAKGNNERRLVKSANVQFDELWKLVNSMSQQQQVAIFNFDGEKLVKRHMWQGIEISGCSCSLIRVASAFVELGSKQCELGGENVFAASV